MKSSSRLKSLNSNDNYRSDLVSFPIWETRMPVSRVNKMQTKTERRNLNHNFIQWLSLLLLLTPTANIHAQLYSYPYYYSTNNNTVTILRYVGSGRALNIPNTINTLPVAGIGDNAFYNAWFNNYSAPLTNITIPNSVISIGTNAFGLCTNLMNVTIGTNVTSIGANAFDSCARLVICAISRSPIRPDLPITLFV